MTSKQPSPRLDDRRGRAARDREADAVLAACRVLVAVSAQSIAAVEDVADLAQVRALVVIASRGSVSLSELSESTKIHLTRASRLCDRLVVAGLINRADDPADRRQLVLTLTAQGQQVVEAVMRHRRSAIASVLDRMAEQMPEKRRAEVVTLLEELAAASGEPSDADLWAMGWTT